MKSNHGPHWRRAVLRGPSNFLYSERWRLQARESPSFGTLDTLTGKRARRKALQSRPSEVRAVLRGENGFRLRPHTDRWRSSWYVAAP